MPSSYPHEHAYDLFVSYSTPDLKWVRVFHDDLVEDINRLTKPDVFSFLDKDRLQPGFIWNEQLHAAASDSAILVPILTPRFFDSGYCQRELNAFIEAHGLASGLAHSSRIFPVKLLQSAPSDHVLAQVQATSFCSERKNGTPFEHPRGTAKYNVALRDLAYAIAQVLKTLQPKQQGRAAVYLAPDFQPRSDKLRGSLEHHFDVLPEDPKLLLGLSPEEEEFRQSLERDFARCFVSVHPLTDKGFAKPLVEAHLEFARKQTKPRLVWTPDRPDDLTNAGFEWFTSQVDIEDRIRRIFKEPPEKPAEPRVSGVDRVIYFLCPDTHNRDRAEPLLEALEHRGMRVVTSPIEGAADQALNKHVKMLNDLDGCLIYYGDVDRDWFDAVFLRVRKKIRQRKLPSAIFVAPPPTRHKTDDLRYVGVPLVEEADATVKFFLGEAS